MGGRKGLGEEMLPPNGEKEEPRGDQRAGTEDTVSAELRSRNRRASGVEAKARPGDRHRGRQGQIMQGLCGLT